MTQVLQNSSLPRRRNAIHRAPPADLQLALEVQDLDWSWVRGDVDGISSNEEVEHAFALDDSQLVINHNVRRRSSCAFDGSFNRRISLTAAPMEELIRTCLTRAKLCEEIRRHRSPADKQNEEDNQHHQQQNHENDETQHEEERELSQNPFVRDARASAAFMLGMEAVLEAHRPRDNEIPEQFRAVPLFHNHRPPFGSHSARYCRVLRSSRPCLKEPRSKPDLDVVNLCQICYETVLTEGKTEEPNLACQHRHDICTGCAAQHLTTRIMSGRVARRFMTCPMDQNQCTHPELDDECVRSIVGETMYQNLVRFREAGMIADDPLRCFCPHPLCSKVVHLQRKNQSTVSCPDCQHTFCGRCKNETHTGLPCAMAGKPADRAFRSWARSKHVQHCPRCHHCIEKDGGCKHMTCSQCQEQWCWKCHSPWIGHRNHLCNVLLVFNSPNWGPNKACRLVTKTVGLPAVAVLTAGVAVAAAALAVGGGAMVGAGLVVGYGGKEVLKVIRRRY